MSYKKILIAVDDRESSMTVAEKGFELAKQLKAEVALIYVVELTKAIKNNPYIRKQAIENPDIEVLIKDCMNTLVKEAENALENIIKANNISEDIIKFMPEGFPKECILETADTWGADLIVIGLHGKTGFGIFVMGSISQYISLYSKIPVLIIPPKGKEQ
jgi:nucleotide-binding universal stress UspA family protein